jgi:hypothetical protein
MVESSMSTEVPVSTKWEAESFTRHIIEEILPTLDVPNPILTLIGTLTILFNRIYSKDMINEWKPTGLLLIKMEDEYFNQTILEQFLGVLKLPSEKVTDG